MLHRPVQRAAQRAARACPKAWARGFAAVAPATSPRQHKVVVVGGGSAGLSISHQLLRTGEFAAGDIAIVDPAAFHDYQPGWTLVGGGLKTKQQLRHKLADLVDPKVQLYHAGVATFAPADNTLTLGNGDRLGYAQLVVAPGIQIQYDAIPGLAEALADPAAPVSSIYGYDTCDKVFGTVQRLQRGQAIFTQPTGGIKCAGAPQKILWLALDYWHQAGRYTPHDASSPIRIAFATGLPGMFGVAKYSAALEQLRQERGVEGLFQHDLVAVESGNTAVFARATDGQKVRRHFDLLHATPKMGPYAFVRDSPLADAAGYVAVDQATTQSTKYANVWSAGDASSLPTSKTAAAVTAQAPVLVRNLVDALHGRAPSATYDGYTSCPLLTEYGKVMLAEFTYGGTPKETFGRWFGIDQAVPRRAFWYLKKDFFPWVYHASMVKGTWGGPKGWLR